MLVTFFDLAHFVFLPRGVIKFAERSDYVMCLTGNPCAINVSMAKEVPLKQYDEITLGSLTTLGPALTSVLFGTSHTRRSLAKQEFALRGREEWDSRHIIVILSDGQMTAQTPADIAKVAADMKAADKRLTIWTIAVGNGEEGKVRIPLLGGVNSLPLLQTFLRDKIATGPSYSMDIGNYTNLARDLALRIVGQSCFVTNYGSCTHITWLLCLLILIHSVHINFILWRQSVRRGVPRSPLLS